MSLLHSGRRSPCRRSDRACVLSSAPSQRDESSRSSHMPHAASARHVLAYLTVGAALLFAVSRPEHATVHAQGTSTVLAHTDFFDMTLTRGAPSGRESRS